MNDRQTAVENAARTIKIRFSPQEKARLAEELEAFERWLEPLLAVDIADTGPLLFSHPGVNVFREDRPASAAREKLRRVSANIEDGFYRVPSIID